MLLHLCYKQSKSLSDSDQIRRIQFKPDGTIMYVSERETDGYNNAIFAIFF